MVGIVGRKKCNFMQWLEANVRQIQIQRSISQIGSQQDNLPREAMDTNTPKIPIGITHFIRRTNKNFKSFLPKSQNTITSKRIKKSEHFFLSEIF